MNLFFNNLFMFQGRSTGGGSEQPPDPLPDEAVTWADGTGATWGDTTQIAFTLPGAPVTGDLTSGDGTVLTWGDTTPLAWSATTDPVTGMTWADGTQASWADGTDIDFTTGAVSWANGEEVTWADGTPIG